MSFLARCASSSKRKRSRKLPHLRHSCKRNQRTVSRIVEGKEIMDKLKEIVFQGLGEASMCWSETPKGVFDSDRAKRVGDEIMQAIEEEMSGKTITIEAR